MMSFLSSFYLFVRSRKVSFLCNPIHQQRDQEQTSLYYNLIYINPGFKTMYIYCQI